MITVEVGGKRFAVDSEFEAAILALASANHRLGAGPRKADPKVARSEEKAAYFALHAALETMLNRAASPPVEAK